jgi:hypothetical protein
MAVRARPKHPPPAPLMRRKQPTAPSNRQARRAAEAKAR